MAESGTFFYVRIKFCDFSGSCGEYVCICVPCSGIVVDITSMPYTLYILIILVMVAQGIEALTHHVN